jgi:hypothetical protein
MEYAQFINALSVILYNWLAFTLSYCTSIGRCTAVSLQWPAPHHTDAGTICFFSLNGGHAKEVFQIKAVDLNDARFMHVGPTKLCELAALRTKMSRTIYMSFV